MTDADNSVTLVRAARRRGILSERDREYLLDESDVEPGSAHERMIRKDIRDRLKESLRDFQLLLEYFQAKDRNRVGEDLISPGGALEQRLAEGVGFLYLMATDHPEIDFSPVCERGIHAGAKEAGQSVHKLSVEIEAHPADLGALREKLESAEGISLLDFERLLQSEAFPTLDADQQQVSFHMEFEDVVEDVTDVTIRLERE